MVQIPTRDSQLSLQPTMVDARVVAQRAEQTINVAEGLSSLGGEMQKHDDWRQTQEANITLAKKHNENVAMAHSDPDLDTISDRLNDKYAQDIDEAAKSIRSASARNTFIEKSSLMQEIQAGNLQSVIYRRKSNDGKAKMVANGDAIIGQIQNTADPSLRQALIDDFVSNAKDAAAQGYANPLWVQNYIDTHLKQIDVGQVAKDIEDNKKDVGLLEKVKENLQQGYKGLYKNLTDKERAAFSGKVDATIERQKTIGRRIEVERRNNTEHDLSIKSLEGLDISKDLEENFLNKTISRSYYDKMSANLSSSIGPTATTDKQVYHDIVNKLLSIGRPTDMTQYDTKLSPDEEKKFQEWKKKIAPNDSGEDYDLRGAFKDGLTRGENFHFSDKYKKPNHPTFSNESIYSKGSEGKFAGHWDGDNYIPSSERFDDGVMTSSKAREMIIDANTKGKLSPMDAKKLYHMNLIPDEAGFTNLADKVGKGADADLAFLEAQDKKSKAVEEKKVVNRTLWDMITGHTEDPVKRTDMLDQAIKDTQKTPLTKDNVHSVASKVVSDSILKRFPDIKKHPEGMLFIDPYTRRKVVLKYDEKNGVTSTEDANEPR